jgi:predicted PurR-regulated permease PerM
MKTLEERNSRLLNVTLWLFVIALSLLMVYLASDIITPLILATLYSVLVIRFVDFFEDKTFLNRVASIVVVLVFSVLLVAALVFLLGNQVAGYFDDLPTIEKNVQQHLKSFQHWLSSTFGFSIIEQKNLIEETTSEQSEGLREWLLSSNIFSSFSGTLVNTALLPIYTFLILLYKRRIKKFLFAKFGKGQSEKLTTILSEIKELIKFYLNGLLLQMLFIFILSLIGFWIAGAPHIIFLALLCALLNLIPYVGILFAGLICVFSTLSAQDNLSAVLGVIIVIGVVQLVENNFISPKIVGSKVRLNPLATIVAIIAGGSLAGVAGMFLAIPILAIVNIIIQHVDSLRPYSYLISDTSIKDLEEMTTM